MEAADEDTMLPDITEEEREDHVQQRQTEAEADFAKVLSIQSVR